MKLRDSAIWSHCSRSNNGHFCSLCLFLASICLDEDLVVFVMVVWSVWTNKNDLVFNGKWLETRGVLERATRVLGDYQMCDQKLDTKSQ